ncbi:sensor histidine kinase [Streptomyces candidus]|uniref:histidine kinase n=1 Tax=Streptomyces candidus TaxID=67283 RepID=A0A7X0HAN8_9ACTN|nr:sensor histidine kinase [Streptomyces candidus]MBB6434200.1 signal transduction histidine kinase [Streptomyces candidus]
MALPSRVRGLRASPWPAGRAADAAVTLAAVLLVTVWTLVAMRYETETAGRALIGWALTAVGCGALYFRRRWPVAVAVVTLLACAAYYPLNVYDGPLMVTFALALYTASAEGRLVPAVALAAATLLAVGFGEAGRSEGHRQVDNVSLAMLAGWLISLVALGRVQHTRAAYLHEVEQRALAAEREQEARARQSATEERLRIARELHDVLGHSISLINVQSSAVLHKLGKGPDPAVALAAAEEALTAVKATSKDALRELRSTLGMLRQADEAAPTSPVPGLDRLDALVARARAAGLDVRTHVEGAPRPLPPPLDLAAYRIVQESLTNVTRHAHACHVSITLGYADDAVRLTIEDDGDGAPDARSTGSGILGMTERARAFGGELTAHNTAEGFRVEARLPLEEHA